MISHSRLVISSHKDCTIASETSAHFHSLEELLAFIERVLITVTAKRPEET